MTRVEIVNPLPDALHHYAQALSELLGATGAQVTSLATTSAERRSSGRGAVPVLLDCLRDRLLGAPPPSGTHRLVLWPVLGYPELAMWRGAAPDISVVFHDPTPLRRQVGLGRQASRATRVAGTVRATRQLLVHSPAALTEIRSRGFDAEVLPLPILTPAPGRGDATSRQVLVLGQHKDTRDLDLLSSLGPVLRSRGLHPRIVGRGWPSVPGWDVDARFVSDEEFGALLRSSAVVLLPYTKVYQSDVAVRAAECAVPVVAAATTNVAQLYGADWCGLVSGTGGHPPEVADWVAALERVLASPEGEVQPRVASYHAAALRAWERWLAGV